MLQAKASAHTASGRAVTAAVPFIRSDIPVMIVFRALGFCADRDILAHICYDFRDEVCRDRGNAVNCVSSGKVWTSKLVCFL